ncbi:MAG: hypothetical protein AB1425_05395 [Actinomycetota bacterium]
MFAEDFPDFAGVEIRERPEYEPQKLNIGLLERAASKKRSCGGPKNSFKKRKQGCYRARTHRPYAEEHGRYLTFLRRKEGESLERRSRGLIRSGLEELTRLRYAPAYRAKTNELSLAAWEECHRQLAAEEARAA